MASNQTKNLDSWARLTGFLYLFSNATASFGYWVRGSIFVARDPAVTAANMLAYQTLFRIGLVAELVTIIATITLVFGSYAILKELDRNLALLGLLIRVVENAVLASLAFLSFVALGLLEGPFARSPAAPDVAYTLVRVHMYGFQNGFLFLGVGSLIFSWLWFRSKFIPQPIAILGIVGSAIMALAALALTISPSILATITLAYMAPMGLFEVGIGFWLLFRGIRTEVRDDR